MEVTAYSPDGKARPQPVQLPDSIFDGAMNASALHQVTTAILAHQRQGTASTKNRAVIRGGKRKPWRQKGTGRARAGSIRSPLWRGGAVAFGPHPRAYDPRVSRKLRRLALRSALNARALEGDLAVFEAPRMETPRTKTIAEFLAGVGAAGHKVLFLTNGINRELLLSARNIPNVAVKPWGDASAYDLLWADLVLVESTALEGTSATGADIGRVSSETAVADAPEDDSEREAE